MGCGGDREKGNVAMEEKWDYVVRDNIISFPLSAGIRSEKEA